MRARICRPWLFRPPLYRSSARATTTGAGPISACATRASAVRACAACASAAAAAAAREPRRATLPLRTACSRVAAWSFSCCARASRVAVAGVAAVAVRLGEGFFAVRTAPFGIGRFGSRPLAGASSSSGVRGGPVGPRPAF